ncbi:hypothetical protein HD599_001401 [Conyzicola lurida]|uniref:FAR-17a/AIG1-like protein n=1 Tax=Conyzicola lurida TaxID=1172621 RepID=A0A841AL53_9MICO|nr:Pr6Pr family membrane protein [Conyzicola lurida]MBB5843078.1 hypothetical protein [Conyzicola lurida]
MTTMSYPHHEHAVRSHAQATGARRMFGLLRLAAAAAVAVALSAQITDLVVNDALVPENYFSYFTVQSSLINIVVLATGGVLALRWRDDPERFTAVRMTTVAFAVLTAAVYNVLLRGIPPEGYVGPQWPGEVMHVAIPVVIVLDWLLSPGRPALHWDRVWLALVYPFVWLAFTLVRGVVTGWYPYPFLNPDGPDGPVSVIVYVAVLFALILAVAAVAVGISRLGGRHTPR